MFSSSKFFSRTSTKLFFAAGVAIAASVPAYRYYSNNFNPSAPIHADASLPSFPKLTSSEIHAILSKHENTTHVPSSDSIIDTVYSNHYNANSPIEDYQVFEALGDRSTFIAVLDGHGGDECSKWLSNTMGPVWKRGIYEMTQRVKEIEAYYQVDNLKQNVDKIKDISQEQRNEMKQALDHKLIFPELFKMSFTFLDQMFFDRAVNMQDMGRAQPGSCALAAYTLDDELYVANLGDCRAVLGRKHWWSGKWEAVPLTIDQTATSETERLQKEHPNDPHVVREGRVKGILIPSRSIGDVILKVPGLLAPEYVARLHPFEPPYVSSIPEVSRYELKPNKGDSFIIIATDGLWDALSNDEAVQLVGAHLDASSSDNVCTTLIRRALCKNPVQQRMSGLSENDNLSIVLTCPEEYRRNLHDDITVKVAVLRKDYKVKPENKDRLPDAERVHYPEEIEDLMRKSQAQAMKMRQQP